MHFISDVWSIIYDVQNIMEHQELYMEKITSLSRKSLFAAHFAYFPATDNETSTSDLII